MNTSQVIHTEACVRAMARQEAYDARWPRRCKQCFGAGGGYYSFGPSPRGSGAPSLAPGTMQDFDTCSCVDNGQCPRCGEQLAGPKWRPLNFRTQLGYHVGRLAVHAQHARPQEVVGRAVYWRALAAFRENPNPWTWALYHAADHAWTVIFSRNSLPTWLAHRLWNFQGLLERGGFDDLPCWHCGWNWNKSPGDAREPHECECWVAGFEADEARLLELLELDGLQRVSVLLVMRSLLGGG